MRFLDGTKVLVNGLTEILTDLQAEGLAPTVETSRQILERLEAAKNHVPASAAIRREYAQVLLEEYKTHLAEHARASATTP